jgi:hypothetical protein
VETDPVDPELPLVPFPEDVVPVVPEPLPLEVEVAAPLVLVLLDAAEDDPELLDPVVVSGAPEEPVQATTSQGNRAQDNRVDVSVT